MDRFGIVFDRGTFFPGEPVSGKVVLKIGKEISAHNIKISIHGAGRTEWKEVIRNTRYVDGKPEWYDETLCYSADLKILSREEMLWKAKTVSKIPAGHHVFPFSFRLPSSSPPSFEGKHGHIRYGVEAELDRPWRFNQVDRRDIKVSSYLSPSPLSNSPATKKDVKEIGVMFKKGVVKMKVTIPKQFVSPGEEVPITISVDNESSRPARRIRWELQQQSHFHASRDSSLRKKSTHHEQHRDKIKTVAEFSRRTEVPPYTKSEKEMVIKIPALPPTFQSTIIKNEYVLVVKLDTETSLNNTLRCEFALVIGKARPRPSAVPSAPALVDRSDSMPPDYSSLMPLDHSGAGPSEVPPSYEDSISVTKM
ncbi:hypothetical protein CAEBREN_00117 [Caenorhabditis brenneri]|uniref:Arrestin C-terminal-like domain-containing protein n=1 Tax=Caenorhabditis brenneri TaxID=135651 RepID=G0NHN0_CAEBE|nr:hypothetical protein CAEBREN_00117 [Caenorhabditis brenneri]